MSYSPEEHLSTDGYFITKPGETLQGGRWSIIRKLGLGPRSSTWLAIDSTKTDRIEAIKIFTRTATEGRGASNELEILKGPMQGAFHTFPSLREHFYEDTPKGRHLCLVLHVLGPSVESFRLTNDAGGYLPLHIVKKITADVLESLCELGKRRLVHGAVTTSNFLFGSAQTAGDILEEIARESNAEPCEVTFGNGISHTTVKSQPLGPNVAWNCTREDIANESIYLSNFGYAHPTHRQSICATPVLFAPPEAIQGKAPGAKSDIWALGISAYLLLTGVHLFKEASIEHYQETVKNIEKAIQEAGTISSQDLSSTLAFLKSCLQIDPSKRPTADDLAESDWVQGGYVCSCGWCQVDDS